MNWKPITELPELTRLSADWPFKENVKPLLVWVAETGPAIGRATQFNTGQVEFTANGYHGNWTITHWCEITAPEGVQQ
jgi:hypothetical protein